MLVSSQPLSPSLSLSSLITSPHHSPVPSLLGNLASSVHFRPPARPVPHYILLFFMHFFPPITLIYFLLSLSRSPGHFLNGSYCSFEEGECSWQLITGRGLSWRRLQSPTKANRQSCPSSGSSWTSLVMLRTLLCDQMMKWLICRLS